MLYPIRKGDTLTRIAEEQYNAFGPAARETIDRILELNPQIKSPDMIYAGHMLLLQFPLDNGHQPGFSLNDLLSAQQKWNSKPKSEQAALAETARVITALDVAKRVTQFGGTGASQVSSILSTNKRHYYNTALEYVRYKRDLITKSRYYDLRNMHLQQLQHSLGPLEKPLFGNRTVFETFRMAPGRSSDPVAPFLKQIDRLDSLNGMIRRGGVILDYMALPLNIYDIATTKDSVAQDKKLVSLVTGVAAGKIAQIGISRLVVGVALAATPVGWGAALVIGVGSIVAGEIVSHFAAEAYEKHFSNVRIVDVIEDIVIPGVE
jgi:hypothetical protein